MRDIGRLTLLAALFLLQALPSSGQEGPPSLDPELFVGWQEWPLITPVELDLDTSELSNQRIVFDGVFGPPGQGRPVTMYMDVFEHWYGERPTFWIQWTSSGNPVGAPEGMGIDALLVDRRSLQVLFRVAASAPGSYEVTRHGEDETELYQIDVGEDSSAEFVLEGAHPTFDFAAFQFLFPFLELEEGRGFRLANIGQPPELVPGEVAVRVAGQIQLELSTGDTARVWDVQVVPPHQRAIIHFYVTEEPPFFYGWDYFTVRGTATTMRLFDWQPTIARTPPAEMEGD